jgi:hypothetical protein
MGAPKQRLRGSARRVSRRHRSATDPSFLESVEGLAIELLVRANARRSQLSASSFLLRRRLGSRAVTRSPIAFAETCSADSDASRSFRDTSG